MNNKSYLLLVILILVLAFILGFRSGQKVEKTNEKINYLLSITPTKVPPTPTPISYKEYNPNHPRLNHYHLITKATQHYPFS